jgi:hypothetical protein
MVDRYTKVVLTVIAISLVWIGVRDFAAEITPAWAQGTVSVYVTGGRLDYETDISGGPTLKVCTSC